MTSVSPGPRPLRLGTRGSTLAWTQSSQVAQRLGELLGQEVELVRIQTHGDVLKGSLAQLGGTGVFVTALREALLDGRCDIAVHSLKDLPVEPVPGLRLVVPARADAHDVLCTRTGGGLASLAAGARVGTGSPRRAAQLLAARPDLEIVDIRGNVDTRLARVGAEGDLDAVVLAQAGLARIGRLGAVSEVLGFETMLPAPGQGALAVEVRAADGPDPVLDDAASTALHTALDALDDRATHLAVLAERAFLGRLEAGCAAPLGAIGRLTCAGADADGTPVAEGLTLEAVAVTPDGATTVRRSAWVEVGEGEGPLTATDAAELGAALADEVAPLVPEVVGSGR